MFAPLRIAGAALLLAALPLPAAAAPDEPAPEPEVVHGAAVSTLAGPTGFANNEGTRGPTLQVEQLSVRAQLLPDAVLVEQTYAIHNPSDAALATVGIRQAALKYAEGKVLRTFKPYGAIAYLNGRRLDEALVRLEPYSKAEGFVAGYEVGITGRFRESANTLTVKLAFQTVANTKEAGMTRPAGAGWSRVALLISHYSWGWTDDDKSPEPITAVAVELGEGVDPESLVAERWTDGALRKERTIYWRATPWLVLRYQSKPGAARAHTADELNAICRRLLDQQPRDHVTIPDDVERMDRPGRPEAEEPIDEARARRALIVPVAALMLVITIIYLIIRWRRSHP